ncbi:MAG: hypothetical protein QXU64_02125 [Thermofilaceae archaeon]
MIGVLVDVVRVQARRRSARGGEEAYYYEITIPSRMARELGIRKGEPLVIRLVELELEGVRRKAIVLYRPI